MPVIPYGCSTLMGFVAHSRRLKECKTLQVLDVSGNPALGRSGCLDLLFCCLPPSPIKDLRMTACGLCSPLPTKLWDAQCSLDYVDLSDNYVSSDDRDKIVQWWSRLHTAKHKYVVYGSLLTLYTHRGL